MGALLQDGLADETVGRNITLTLTQSIQLSCQLTADKCSAREDVKIEPEHVKLKNLHC
jgi:hypothetical protein